jgi:hypothetical protein
VTVFQLCVRFSLCLEYNISNMSNERTNRVLQCYIDGIKEKYWRRALDSMGEKYKTYPGNKGTLYVVFDNIDFHNKIMGVDDGGQTKYVQSSVEDLDNFHDDELLREEFDIPIMFHGVVADSQSHTIKTAAFLPNPYCELTNKECDEFPEGSEPNRSSIIRLVLKSAKILSGYNSFKYRSPEELKKLVGLAKFATKVDKKTSTVTFTSKEDAFVVRTCK